MCVSPMFISVSFVGGELDVAYKSDPSDILNAVRAVARYYNAPKF